jgi:lipopolysaccharide transport system ATP-binding protein
VTPSVRFDRVSKKFRRGEMHDSLRDLVAAGIARLLGRRTGPARATTFWALRDLSFAVEAGQALGIIGPNGAGKSTVLKLLSGILRCDGGSIDVNGRLSALIEVGAGLHGDLTGRENIYLSGAIMGMTRREIDSKLDQIIAFSGLEDFIDTPVKRYSTGMQARLGFSTAAHVCPDVMLVDEVLSVGDVAFRHRCEERMAELVHGGAALIFVTHNLEQMRAVCDRALVLDAGRCTFLGAPEDAVGHYLQAVAHRTGELTYMDHPRPEDTPASHIGLRFLDGAGADFVCAGAQEPVTIEIRFRLRHPVPRLTVETALRRANGELIVSLNSRQHGITYAADAGDHRVTITLPALPLASGAYLALVRLWDADRARLLGETPYRYTLQLDDRGQGTGLVAFEHEWSDLERLGGAAAAAPVEALNA